MQIATNELERLANKNRPMSLGIIDIDDFKNINDQFGHAIGDTVIKKFAVAVNEKLSADQHFGRIGGEEFMLLMPRVTADECTAIIDKIRKQVASLVINIEDQALSFTISCGVAYKEQHPIKLDELMKQADLALYQAKNSGKNQVVMWGNQ